MTTANNQVGPLPAELRKAASELRRVELPADFQARLNRALMVADQGSWNKRAEPNLWTRAGGAWLALVPGAAGKSAACPGNSESARTNAGIICFILPNKVLLPFAKKPGELLKVRLALNLLFVASFLTPAGWAGGG